MGSNIRCFEINKYNISKYKNDPRFMLLEMNVCCSNRVANNTLFLDEAIESAMETFIGMPIVAKVKNYFSSKPDFGEHDLEIKIDTDGTQYYYYHERPVGFVPESSNIKIVPDEKNKSQKWLVLQALIWVERDYQVYKIIKRRKKIGISMEIEINEFEEQDGIDVVKKFTGLAITLLGEDKVPAFRTSVAVLKENFSEFKTAMCYALEGSSEKGGERVLGGLTVNQMRNKLRGALDDFIYEVGEEEFYKYWLEDFDDTFAYVYDNEDGNFYRIPYELDENKNIVLHIESIERVEMEYTPVQSYSTKIEVYLDKDQWGTGEEIKVDKSKEAVSNYPWGKVNKTKLRNMVLKAKNYKSLVHDVYAKVEEGWEDHPSSSLKYPIMQITDNKAVYNSNALKSAQGYAQANNETAVVEKVKAIRKRLGLLKEEGEEMEKIKESFKSIDGYEFLFSNDKHAFAINNCKIYAIPYEVIDDTVKMSVDKAICCDVLLKYAVESLTENEKIQGVTGLVPTNTDASSTVIIEEFFSEQFSNLITERQQCKSELDSINCKYEELCNKYNIVESELKEYKNKEFMMNIHKVIDKFEMEDELKKEWIEKATSYSDIEAFEKDLVFAIYTRNSKIKSKDNNNDDVIKFNAGNETTKKKDKKRISPIEELREQFGIKH